jgi:hypothetical protein
MPERQDPADTLRAFQRLVEAPGWDERRQILHATPLLLTDAAPDIARYAAGAAEAEGGAEFARTLRGFAALVERCREIGVDAGLDEAQTALLLSQIKEFVDCYSWADSYHYLMSHADLQSPRAPEVVADAAQRAQANGYDDYAKILRTHERLLRRVAEVGAEAAFFEVGGDDFLKGMRYHAERGT